MSFCVNPVTVASEQEVLSELLLAHLPPAAEPRRFDWLYRRNPAGEAVSLLLMDGPSAIGAASAFPRDFSTPQGIKRGWVLGDFCIDDRYRSLGPALKLQRALIEALERDGAELWYDFPSVSMLAVYRRLRIVPQCSLIRVVKPLRVDVDEAQRRRNSPKIANLIPTSAANLALATLDLPLRLLTDPARSWTGAFNDLFDDMEMAPSDICVARSSRYLNWRYSGHPIHTHDVAIVREDGKVAACAVFRYEENALHIVDIFGDDPAAIEA